MISCPIKQCGRKFQNDETMLQHVRRRHPNQYQAVRQEATRSLIDREHAQQQQLNRLPKLAKIMSRQKKAIEKPAEVALEPPKRSKSKTRKLQSANLSSIIQQSRMTATSGSSKASIASRRPSLTKKVSAPDLKIDKLPPIEKQKQKKMTIEYSLLEQKQQVKKQLSNEQFYSTLPDFKLRAQALVRSRSKGKKKTQQAVVKEIIEPQQQQHQTAPQTLRSTMTTFATERVVPEISADKKKQFLRPTKKIQKKHSAPTSTKIEPSGQQLAINFDQKIVNVSNWQSTSFSCPHSSIIQLLFLNNCNLSSVLLNLQSLIQISVVHNNLTSTDFLNYPRNHNIRVAHIDHNQIADLYLPPKVKVFTASFNMLTAENVGDICAALRKAPELQEIDMSFNAVRKAENYKLKVLGACGKIKKIDGLKVTKIDIQMMQQFNMLQSKHRGLIPLGSPSQDRPTTATSQFYPDITTTQQKSLSQLQQQQKQYKKQIAQTEQQLKIIMQQNQIISSQLQTINGECKQMEVAWDSAALYSKLVKQCEALELLNVIKYADQEQLLTMINKKKMQLGIAVQ